MINVADFLTVNGVALGFQHSPRNLANVYEWKIMFDLYIEKAFGSFIILFFYLFIFFFIFIYFFKFRVYSGTFISTFKTIGY